MVAVAGVDWARREARRAGLRRRGEGVAGGHGRHTEQGVSGLCAKLCELGVQRVAIERPDGLIVERLLDSGLVVLALHPNRETCACIAAAASTSTYWPRSPQPSTAN